MEEKNSHHLDTPHSQHLKLLRMDKIFKNKSLFISLVLLSAVFIVVFITNFPFNSWMTGWDNLHPEFNFSMNIDRALHAVWQKNQGVGTYGGHGYAATLPHTIILFLLSLVLPLMYLRSFFTFFCLFSGGFGMFFLLRKILGKKNETIKNLSGISGALYYVLNFGTVQNFYIQLESFIVHFAVLPWLFLIILFFLEKPSKKTYTAFTLLSIFSTIQGFIPPLFFVYMILLSMFLFFYFLNHFSIKSFGLICILFFSTLVLNAYWFFPVVFYSFTKSATYLNSYNNLSSTNDFILKNEVYGNIKDMSILRGFISEAIDSFNNTVFPIFSQWTTHLGNFWVQTAGYILFGVIIIGTTALVIRKQVGYRWFFVFGFVFTFTMLATDTFPFLYATKLMQHVPVFKQAFRVAFTKFSISLSFFYAVSFGIGVYSLLLTVGKIPQKIVKQISTYSIFVFISILLVYFSWPIFSGNFLYSRTKINIPSIYFDLFSYFKSQGKNERIANLPQGWNWGWSVYDWGYSGSGFLWYGIEQPIMDRAFDVWGRSNENYYWELNRAIYAEDFKQFENILDKYNITWIVLDKNIVPYLNSRGYIYSSEFEKYLNSSHRLTLEKILSPEEKKLKEIRIYKVKNAPKETVRLTGASNINPSYSFGVLDQGFADNGSYITDATSKTSSYYPFRSLYSNTSITDATLAQSGIEIKRSADVITLSATYPSNLSKSALALPSFSKETEILKPEVKNENSNITITTQIPHEPYLSYNSKDDPYFLEHSASNCQEKPNPKPNSRYSQQLQANHLVMTSLNSENCYAILLKNFSQRYGYLAVIESRHISGRQLEVALVNEESKKTDLDYSLSDKNTFETSYIFIAPMKYYGAGYSLLFNNISIGKHESINEIQSVEIIPLAYDLLTQAHFVQENKGENQVLTYYTAYDPDWKAYEMKNLSFINSLFPNLFGTELKNHILVNNWANGWILNNSKSSQKPIYVIFLFIPQYLEYAGFALMGVNVLVLVGMFVKSYFKGK